MDTHNKLKSDEDKRNEIEFKQIVVRSSTRVLYEREKLIES